jgi:hypothetical protein
MAMPFDSELVEFAGQAETGEVVEIYKVGGGSPGRGYAGLWGYRVLIGTKTVASGEDLRTGMPKTHQQAARLVLELLHSDQ